MEIFNNLISGVLLLFTAYGCYTLVRNRPDLFSGESLSRSFRTMGVLGLGLAGLVAMLYYSLPQQPSSPSVSTHLSSEKSPRDDRRV